MSFGKTLSALRREKGLTQKDIAERVYVTRQAVSRWENEEAMPSIDMMKLLALILDVPVLQLMDLPSQHICQCCGTPFDVPNMPYGTEADGSENTDYCKWCYENGNFTSEGLDELIERNIPYLVAGSNMNTEEAVSFMGALLPSLKRWAETANHNTAGNTKRSKLYCCPDCGNIIWSMGEANVSCCGKMLSPLALGMRPENCKTSREVSDGCDVLRIEHAMEKDHFISFIAAIGDDLVRIKKLYPEQEAEAIFPKQGSCRYLAYCNKHGLFEL